MVWSNQGLNNSLKDTLKSTFFVRLRIPFKFSLANEMGKRGEFVYFFLHHKSSNSFRISWAQLSKLLSYYLWLTSCHPSPWGIVPFRCFSCEIFDPITFPSFFLFSFFIYGVSPESMQPLELLLKGQKNWKHLISKRVSLNRRKFCHLLWLCPGSHWWWAITSQR